jgi:hypothetical protein
MLLQEGATALYSAAEKGQVEVVSRLLAAGAAVHITFKVSPSLPLWVSGGAGSTGCGTTFCSYMLVGRLRMRCNANLCCVASSCADLTGIAQRLCHSMQDLDCLWLAAEG